MKPFCPSRQHLVILLGCNLLVLFFAGQASSGSQFSWTMFMPSISTQCYAVSVTRCFHQSNCEAAGGYWYNSVCNVEPEKVCGPDYPALCQSESDCLNAGGYWYENSCNIGQSPNYFKSMQLAGDWAITVDTGHTLRFLYRLDESTIQENPDGSGQFTLNGFDEDGDVVTGAYKQSLNQYTFHVDKGNLTYFYEFDFINTRDVAGCLYVSQHSDNSQSDCFDMVGTNLTR